MTATAQGRGRWTLRVCEGCGTRRCMPADEVVCKRCEPAGGPRSWRLLALREERTRAGVSLEDLAARAEVGAATVRRAECGMRVRSETAVRIAGALGMGVRGLADRERREE